MSEGYTGLPPYYVQSSDPLTPNLGLSLIGMDPIVAADFVKIDTFAAGPFGGSVDVNGVPVPSPANFVNSASVVFSVVGSNITATAAGGGSVTSVFGRTGAVVAQNGDYTYAQISGTPQLPVTFAPVAGEFLTSYNAVTGLFTAATPATFVETWAALTGDLTQNQVIPWDGGTVGTPDTGISSGGSGTILIGNGTVGDSSGGVVCTTVQVSGTGINGGLVVDGSLTDGVGSIGLSGQALVSNGTTTFWGVPTIQWGALANATANLVLSNTNKTSTFTQTSAIIWLWENITVASALTTNQSPVFELQANYWNGTSSLPDDWKLNTILGVGTNGTSTFQFIHTGSTGIAAVKVPNLIDLGTFQDSTGSVGTSGQVLSSTVTGTAWVAASSGSGTVTSVSFTGGLISVATATTTPALTVAGTSGGIPYFSSASTWASSALLAATGVVIGGGAGTAPATNTSLLFSVAANVANLTLGLAGGVSSGEVTLLGATSGSTVLASGATGGGSLTATTGVSIQAGSGNTILMGIGGTNYVQQFTTYVHYGSGIAIGWASTTATGNTADTGISRIAAGVMGIGNGTAGNIAGNLELNRVNIAGIDQAGTATVTAAGTSVVVNYAANYTGTAAPVVVVTPTSDPLASGVPVGYWVVANGGAGAWTGFTLNIQTALAGNIIFNYIVMGKA